MHITQQNTKAVKNQSGVQLDPYRLDIIIFSVVKAGEHCIRGAIMVRC